ncbi:type VI secretion system amidase effector protein Tae4 [Enterobacteriaceae bacterium LUAb1]
MPNNKTVAKTNVMSNSQKNVPLKVITFDELWSAYPSDKIKHLDPRTRKDIFEDHCAINVSEALYKCGVLMKTFKDTRCWNCPTPDATTKRGIHAIRAQELSDYLVTRPFAGCPSPLVLTGNNFEKKVAGKTGIIFFKDYWLRGNEKHPTGDHIDLWNDEKLAGSAGLFSFLRLSFPDITESVSGLLGASYRITSVFKSKQVLFWEIK